MFTILVHTMVFNRSSTCDKLQFNRLSACDNCKYVMDCRSNGKKPRKNKDTTCAYPWNCVVVPGTTSGRRIAKQRAIEELARLGYTNLALGDGEKVKSRYYTTASKIDEKVKVCLSNRLPKRQKNTCSLRRDRQ